MAASEDGRLFVRERIVSADNPDPATVATNIWMMLETGGLERTRAEVEELFEQAGWEVEDMLAVNQELAIMKYAKS